MKALEIARADKLIGKSLDAAVTVYTKDDGISTLLNSFAEELSTVYIVSSAKVVKGDAPDGAFTETSSGIAVKVTVAEGERCDRCWLHSTDTVSDGEGVLCRRCAGVIGK